MDALETSMRGRYPQFSHLTVRAIFRIASVVLLIGTVAHWAACCFAAIGQANLDDPSKTSWLEPEAAILGPERRSTTRYVRALYWSGSTLSTVCYGDIVPTNDSETMAALLLIFIAAFLLSALIGSMTTLLRVGREKVRFRYSRYSCYIRYSRYRRNVRRCDSGCGTTASRPLYPPPSHHSRRPARPHS